MSLNALLVDRLWSRIQIDEPHKCWEWMAGKGDKGYGIMRVNGKHAYAHRLSYEECIGPIPVGLHIDHLCRNRACCNPDHLEAVTCRENVLRGDGLAAANATKTHCPKGHEYTLDNTYPYPGSRRRGCKICRAVTIDAYNKKKAYMTALHRSESDGR